MPLTSGAFTGRDVVVEFAIANEDAILASLTYKRLGMMRGKEVEVSWSTVKTTADMSPAYTETNLVTFKGMTFNGDGVSYADAIFNQKEFKAHTVSPGAATGNQPKVFFRITDPDGSKYEGPFIVDKFKDSRGHANEATWSMNAMSNGDVVYTAA